MVAKNEECGPLSGYRVLDLAGESGYLCAKVLADLGAEVLKVEPPQGEPGRRLPPFKEGLPHLEGSLVFAFYHSNKKGLTLNLHTADGQQILRHLVKDADVVIETFPPGTLEGLGLGYAALREVNPGLIMASITSFGQSGPYRDYQGPDVVAFALSGALHLSGEPDKEPCTAPGNLAYGAASAQAAAAILIALYARRSSGRGQYIDVSALESAALITDSTIPRYSYEDFIMPRYGNCYHWITPGSLYPCKDGFVRIVAGQPLHWRRLVEWMGNPDPLADPIWVDRNTRNQNREFINGAVGEFTQRFTRAQLFQEGQGRGVPVTPVHTPAEYMHSGVAQSRQFFVPVRHPVLGSALYARCPFRFSKTTLPPPSPAPLLGQHNAEIYCGELGYASQELAILREVGVI